MSISNSWEEVALQDLARDITVGFVGPMASEYVTTGIPFLRSLNVEPYRINNTELKYISERFHQRIIKSALVPGDVVIVRTGKPGTAAVIPSTLPTANCSDLVIVRPGPRLDSRYLAYYLNSAARNHISAFTVGAVQQHFNVGSAKGLRIILPPLDEQRVIARILGALDDKVEVNRRMNRTLEDMAQALFKSWFVDFDPVIAKREGRKPFGMHDATAALFPEHFQETEMGPIPKGWGQGKVDDLLMLSKTPINPGDFPDEMFSHYSIPAFDSNKTPIHELGVSVKSNKYWVPDICILISKLNPEIPRVWMPFGSSVHRRICSTEFLVSLPKEPFSTSYVFCLFNSNEFAEGFATLATGTSNSHQRVKPDDLLRMTALLPPEKVVTVFNGRVSSLLNKTHKANTQSSTLASLRDTLLPKLLSGEIRVGQAERIVSEVT